MKTKRDQVSDYIVVLVLALKNAKKVMIAKITKAESEKKAQEIYDKYHSAPEGMSLRSMWYEETIFLEEARSKIISLQKILSLFGIEFPEIPQEIRGYLDFYGSATKSRNILFQTEAEKKK